MDMPNRGWTAMPAAAIMGAPGRDDRNSFSGQEPPMGRNRPSSMRVVAASELSIAGAAP
jgi:streptomycin 6-kinase